MDRADVTDLSTEAKEMQTMDKNPVAHLDSGVRRFSSRAMIEARLLWNTLAAIFFHPLNEYTLISRESGKIVRRVQLKR